MTEAPEPTDKLGAATAVAVNGPEDATLAWDAIDWRAAEESVRRLRQRIFAASQAGNLGRVRNLQRLMLRSRANTLLSVRRVTERNAGRLTAGVDGEVVLTPEAKMELAERAQRLTEPFKAQPVRRVYIPKKGSSSKRRPLGIPTVVDRIAQTVVRLYLEPSVEPVFHEDSYGYRPGRSAHDALRVCRERCWRNDWVLDLDIRKFFDSVPWDLTLKAVAHHTDQRWILLYVERWLKAPLQRKDGSLIERARGTPQGSAISPLLANMFLHYAFDAWMTREVPEVQFERYCDDIIVHVRSERQALQLRAKIATRLAECGLELNEHKTRIVYCKDADRRGSYEYTSFDFVSYTFRPRLSKSRFGKHFVNFSPAVSNAAKTRLRREMRSWRVARRSDKSLTDLALMFNRQLQGWINYYGRFYKSMLYPVFRHFNDTLVRWAMRKYKRLRRHQTSLDRAVSRRAVRLQ
jgi:RNA-directed DNA polymerase